MKYEWRKKEKTIYLPEKVPVLIELPSLKYFTIKGEGNPNDEIFGEYIGVLYSLSYGVRMAPKAGILPEGYFEYTVYPLEGIWDISENSKNNYNGELDKDSLVFTLMIRQPEFVTEELFKTVLEKVSIKKPHHLLDQVKFTVIEEGKCVQIMHVGSYDDEPASFRKMVEFCQKNGFLRISNTHKEIYLSDPRKVTSDKLNTVLRYQVG